LKESELIDNYLEILKFQETVDVEKNWNQLSARVYKLSFKTRLLRFCQSVAAVLFIPLIFFSGYLFMLMHKTTEKTVELVEQTCASGLITSITLSDGTQVWLNSGSKLTYPKEFLNKHRVVKLEGEGFFKVNSDPKNRFDVEIINGSKVSAYGTEFNIAANYGNKQVEVVLVKGNLDVVDSKNQSFTLEPDYQYTFGESSPVYEKTNVYVKTAWKDGKMVFRRAEMEEIARRLANHFNVDIELTGNKISDYQLSATFTTESLTQILTLIEKSTPIKWTTIEPVKLDDMSFTKQKIIIQSLK